MNGNELRHWWAVVRSSMWALPALLTAAAIALAFTTIWIDRQDLSGLEEMWFVFAAGAEGARGVLSTIAGSIITVTGVVFSITIVALQLASSQFTPRVLRSFTEDRVTQLVLGVFIGTFTYALLVLRTVRSTLEDHDRFVPTISVTVALVLALMSIGFLLYFINHIARSIQAEVIIDRVTGDALEVVERLFPGDVGMAAGAAAVRDAERLDPAAAYALHAQGSGYLQALEEEQLLALAEKHELVVRMEKRIGDFVIHGDVLMLVWPQRVSDPVIDALHAAYRLGPDRTRYQDVQRGIIELTDIAVRALSPGINDPTTALLCVDRLRQILADLGAREFPAVNRLGHDGNLRLVARRTTFEEIVQLAFAQLRHHGAPIPAVALRIVESLADLANRVPANRRAVLERELRETVGAARRALDSAADLGRIEAAAALAPRSGSD